MLSDVYCTLVFVLFQITVYAAYLYDSVMLYAKAVHQVLAEGGNITDGRAIIAKILDSNYTGLEVLSYGLLTIYLKETPFNTLTNRVNTDQAALKRAALIRVYFVCLWICYV